MVINNRVVGVILALAVGAGCSSSSSEDGRPLEREQEEVEPEAFAAGAEGFYDVPDPLPAGEHGDLLRYQEAAGAPDGVTWYRVMYASEAVEGEPIVVTGVVVVPDGEAPEGGWPVVSHAHGGNGIADACTPSQALGTDDFVAVEIGLVSSMAAASGSVVVSSDYEGLGVAGEHPFLVGESEGRGVLDIALAVRQLPGVEVGPTTAIAGYSQGGHAALWANQIAEEWAPGLEIVGTMAGAPASELVELLERGAMDSLGVGWVPYVGGMAAAYAEADPRDILTPAGLDALAQFQAECVAWPEIEVSGQALRADPATTEPWRTLLEENTPGRTVGASPVLVVHSAKDETVPVDTTEALLARQCAAGQVVERRILPEGDHVVAAVDAYRQAFDWFAALASGTEPVSSCP